MNVAYYLSPAVSGRDCAGPCWWGKARNNYPGLAPSFFWHCTLDFFMYIYIIITVPLCLPGRHARNISSLPSPPSTTGVCLPWRPLQRTRWSLSTWERWWGRPWRTRERGNMRLQGLGAATCSESTMTTLSMPHGMGTWLDLSTTVVM